MAEDRHHQAVRTTHQAEEPSEGSDRASERWHHLEPEEDNQQQHEGGKDRERDQPREAVSFPPSSRSLDHSFMPGSQLPIGHVLDGAAHSERVAPILRELSVHE